jgi:hypothetical protein
MKNKILLFLIILFGLSFRVYGINFDQACCQHPDERAIVLFALPLNFPSNINQFLSVQSPLNPHFFAYGNLPLYLLKSTAITASIFNPHLLEYSNIDLVGRSISIFADLVTILTIFLIGKTLKNNNLGLAAAFVYSTLVLPIQYSHFYTSDILLTMFISITLWRIIRFYKKPTFLRAALMGVALGLCLATKISAVPLVIASTAAIFIDFIFVFLKSPHKIKRWLPHIPHVIRKLATEGAVSFVATVLTFMIAQPYAIIDWPEFLKQNIEQSKMTHDAYTFPYTLQYVGKIPYFYELKNMFMWGIGPVVFILTLIGLLKFWQEYKKYDKSKKAEFIIIFSFLTLYFLIVGSFAIGFMRYLLPIYPILSIFAGLALLFVFEKINLKDYINYLIKGVVILLILIWPLSFISIYSKTNTRIASTDWVNKNIPAKSTLTHELWDDTIPMDNKNQYTIIDLALYDQPDDSIKWQGLREKLNKTDYVIIASNRLYVPIEHLADCSKYKVCFPIASKFYQDLFNNKLKFKKVAEIESFPTIPILNIPINDQSADESFTVYDHPKIMIFKKTK